MAGPQPDLHTQVTLVTGQGDPVGFPPLDPQTGGWVVSDPGTHDRLTTIQVQLAAMQARLDAMQVRLDVLATEATLAAVLARQADGTQRAIAVDAGGDAIEVVAGQLRITAV